MSAPTLVRMSDGHDIEGSSLTCEGCGSDVASHTCVGEEAPAPTVVRTRSTGPRKAATEHPECPHCHGRIHFSMSGTAINAECLTRQYAVDRGLMTDPNGRLPVLTLEMMKEIHDWGTSLSVPPTYGKMESAAGGAATYSGLRPKTGRKKALAADPGTQIQDIAEGIDLEDEEVVPVAPKAKKARKSKAKTATEAIDGVWETALTTADEASEAPVEEPVFVGGVPLDEYVEEQAEAVDPDEAKRLRREERTARRKELLERSRAVSV